jgi:hypothetical protein
MRFVPLPVTEDIVSHRLIALGKLLGPHVKKRADLIRSLAPLGPLYAAAEDSDYRLAHAGSFDHGSVRMVITVATGRPASGLLLLSPAKMAPALLRILRWRSLGDALREQFEKPLAARLPPALRKELDLHVVDLELALAQALIDGVWDDAPDAFLDGPPEDVLYGIRTAVWCYAALVALEDDDSRRLAPLIRLLASGTLIGESIDLPGTWVLLVAPA